MRGFVEFNKDRAVLMKSKRTSARLKKDNDHQTYWTQIHTHQNLHLLCYNLLDYKYGVFLFLGYKNWVIVNDFKIIKPFKILDLLKCSIIAFQSGQQSRLQMR